VRTTLNLEPDALQDARAKAAHKNVPLGRAVSGLILQAWQTTSPPREKSGAVFRSAGGIDTAEPVEEALDDD
jgi:hypothetical protein